MSLVLLAFVGIPAIADDGPMVRKQVTKTPNLESDHAQLSMMQFYIPATRADGTLATIAYYADRDGDNQPDEFQFERAYAKPLIVTYQDEEPTGAADYDILTGDEVGVKIRRDAYAAFSLDDGDTWKEINLAESAIMSSFTLANGTPYPGDVTQMVHAVAGNKILVAWTSKYADQGSPRYSVKDELDIDGDGDTEEPLYRDLFDVAGNQGSIDYTEWMHHGQYPFAHVGEVPFSAVWTARGTIEQVINPQTGVAQWGVKWRKPERLTSGKRDAYYLTIDGVEGAGFAIAWQEDPEGLRPGYGEGPGVGWSGATVNHKTDIWYSYIDWDLFDAVNTTDQDPATNKPKVAELMSMPVRISDNYNGLSDRVDSDGNPHPGYIFEDFNGNGTPDLCAQTYQWTNSQGEVKNICVTEDGRLLNGQTGSSRARMALEKYTKADGTISAWVVMAYEETKGLGAGHSDIDPLDIGKDVMYHSFDMFTPDIAAPGTMMNLPETDPLSASENPTFLPLLPNDMGQPQYQSSIGRRPSLIVQPGYKIAQAAASGTVGGMTSAVVLYKDGAERQGGPSDVFMRRFVLPSGFNPAVDNPYSVKYLHFTAADTNILTTSPSAYPASAYPNGFPTRGAVNLSGTTPLTFEPLDNETPEHGITQRVLTWTQTSEDLGDESWENKYDVAKGHRGFIDGNFLMVMYAYSPNWLATSKGHEPYNLFIRRSFDGGVTWTTTPSSLGGDGTTYDQLFGVGDRVWTETRVLGAGVFEPARNVSQLSSSHETVLDPRYSPTNIGTQTDVSRILLPDGTYRVLSTTDPLYDMRDPSKFFAVYETGDATVVLTAGEADPWDLYGSRATNWGDDWETYDLFATGQGVWEERWDWLENKDETRAGESSVALSPDGQFAWVVWNEWVQDESDHVTLADPMFRRLWWDDSATLIAEAGTYVAAEGSLVPLTGSAVYDGDVSTLTYEWDLDMDGVFETTGKNVGVLATGSMQGVALRVCNGAGNCDIDQGWINKKAHTPRVWMVQATANPSLMGQEVRVSARFTDPGSSGSHRAFVDWGDGVVVSADTIPLGSGQGAALVVAKRTFVAKVGLFTIKVTVTDNNGNSGWDYLRYAVVHSSTANVDGLALRFISPNGGGTADLDFFCKYENGETPPAGQMKFKLGTLDFEATAFDWLVARGTRVFISGTGTLNGQEGYNFLVSSAEATRVRVKIWKADGLTQTVIYDSQPGAEHNALPTTTLTRGKIRINRM
jgi:hypothetical protein